MTVSDESSTRVPRKASPRRRFHLSGRSAAIDPRTHAVRGDLADLVLADRVFAPHYAEALTFRAVADTQIRLEARGESLACQTLKTGDVFHVLDLSGGWAWGHGGDAQTVGYVETNTLVLA